MQRYKLGALLVGAFLLFVGSQGWGEYQAYKALPGALVKLSVGCSGVHIGNGNILTAAHCTDDTNTVETDQGITLVEPATLMWASKTYDVALLNHPLAKGVKAAGVYCKALRVGDEIEAAGHPLGKDWLHMWGRVARTEGRLDGELVWPSVVSIDVTGGPGMSGGPVYKDGLVAGLTVAGPGVKVPLRTIIAIVPMTTIARLMPGTC